MTALIKSCAAAGRVRPFGTSVEGLSSVVAAPPPPSPEEARQAELLRENAELRAVLAAAADEAARSVSEARDKARGEALAEAGRRDDERLKAVQDGIAAALADWRDQLTALERLAPLLARTALAKILDRSDDYAELVTRSIGRQVRTLGREAVVAIHVSREDFPAEEALTAIRADAGSGELELLIDGDLAAGDCRMKLRLGHLDISIAPQLREVSALLDAASQGAEE